MSADAAEATPAVDPLAPAPADDEMNNNNLTKYSPYLVTELDGVSDVVPDPPVTGPHCKDCGRVFESFSKQMIHESKPCSEDKTPVPEGASNGHDVRLSFPEEQLPYIQALLDAKGVVVESGEDNSVQAGCVRKGGPLYIVIPSTEVANTLFQLYASQTSLYNLEQWYEPLVNKWAEVHDGNPPHHVTAPTQFLALSDEDLKTLQSVNMRRQFGMTNLTREDNAALAKVEAKIRPLLEEGKTYFCRLSTRSPKDAIEVETIEGEAPAERLARRNATLQVTSAQQITDLLVRSKRVFIDITNYFKFRVEGAPGDTMNLVLREFVPLLHDKEFRCYVHNKRITAISQYFVYDVFDSLQDRESVLGLRDEIVAFHASVCSAFPFDSYVFDVGYAEDGSVSVIELNPYGAFMSSGAGLYHWEDDMATLYGQDGDETDIRVLLKESE